MDIYGAMQHAYQVGQGSTEDVRPDAGGAAAAYRDFLEDIGGIALEADAETWRLRYVSARAEEILGYPLARWYEEPDFWPARVVNPDDLPRLVRVLHEEVGENGTSEVDFRAVHADGSLVWIRGMLRLSQTASGERRLRGLLLNIDERKQTEETLRKSEERLHLALNAATMGVWDWDVEQSAIYWSDQVYHLHGCSENDLDGTYEGYMSLIDRVDPDDANRAQEIIRDSLQTGQDYGIEYRMHLPDGGVRWLYAKGCIYFDEKGNPSRIAGTVQDITDRKHTEARLKVLTETLELRVRSRTAELEQTNTKLRLEINERIRAEGELARTNAALLQSNRELQDFAYIASHDLQEPLRKITTFADLLRAECGDDIDGSGLLYVDRMQHAAQRMTELIRGLLEFSRVKTRAQPFEPVDLNEIARSVLVDLEVALREGGGEVRTEELPVIEAGPTQMRQLFQNLVGNALKFRRDGVSPVVTIRAVPPPEGAEGQGRCVIEIEDNGIGFDERYLDRIFTPFQRLHGRGRYEGTGMGLAICRRIVERHGGTITARSAPGKGSTFVITLPLRQS